MYIVVLKRKERINIPDTAQIVKEDGRYGHANISLSQKPNVQKDACHCVESDW